MASNGPAVAWQQELTAEVWRALRQDREAINRAEVCLLRARSVGRRITERVNTALGLGRDDPGRWEVQCSPAPAPPAASPAVRHPGRPADARPIFRMVDGFIGQAEELARQFREGTRQAKELLRHLARQPGPVREG